MHQRGSPRPAFDLKSVRHCQGSVFNKIQIERKELACACAPLTVVPRKLADALTAKWYRAGPALARRKRPWPRRYFKLEVRVVNLVESFVPTALTPVMITMAMRAAIR